MSPNIRSIWSSLEEDYPNIRSIWSSLEEDYKGQREQYVAALMAAGLALMIIVGLLTIA